SVNSDKTTARLNVSLQGDFLIGVKNIARRIQKKNRRILLQIIICKKTCVFRCNYFKAFPLPQLDQSLCSRFYVSVAEFGSFGKNQNFRGSLSFLRNATEQGKEEKYKYYRDVKSVTHFYFLNIRGVG